MKILSLKNRILVGVYAIYAIRRLRRPFVTETFALAILGAVLSAFVSVPSVISNTLDAQSAYKYFAFAFSNTTLVVQLILVLGLVAAVKTVISLGHLSSVGRARLS